MISDTIENRACAWRSDSHPPGDSRRVQADIYTSPTGPTNSVLCRMSPALTGLMYFAVWFRSTKRTVLKLLGAAPVGLPEPVET